jgi:hypothetical protein
MGLPLVNSTLAVAPDTVAPDAVAPDAAAPDTAAPDTAAPHPHAPNAAALDATHADMMPTHGAGASPAPTSTHAHVGATLAVAPDAVAPDPVASDAAAPDPPIPWTIPTPEKTNPNPTLADVIGAFKSLVFTVYLDWMQANDPTRLAKFWQRNYYEHIIRNQRELHAIRRYIRNNPAQWALDRDNPLNFRHTSPPRGMEDYLADIQALSEDGEGE